MAIAERSRICRMFSSAFSEVASPWPPTARAFRRRAAPCAFPSACSSCKLSLPRRFRRVAPRVLLRQRFLALPARPLLPLARPRCSSPLERCGGAHVCGAAIRRRGRIAPPWRLDRHRRRQRRRAVLVRRRWSRFRGQRQIAKVRVGSSSNLAAWVRSPSIGTASSVCSAPLRRGKRGLASHGSA